MMKKKVFSLILLAFFLSACESIPLNLNLLPEKKQNPPVLASASSAPSPQPSNSSSKVPSANNAQYPDLVFIPKPNPNKPAGINRKPILQQILANPTQTARKNDIITFKILSFDPDGDPLRFTWQATKGLLSANQGTDVSWQPQKTDGSFESGTATITAIADDNHGGIDSISTNIFIDNNGAVNTQTQPLSAGQTGLPNQVIVSAVETPSNEITLPAGQQKQLSASALLSDQSRSQEILWLSSNSTVVSVSPTGQLTRHSPGDVVIFAKSLLDPNKQQTIRVTETAAAPLPTALASNTPAIPIPGAAPSPSLSVLAIPTGLSASNISQTGFGLAWTGISGASSYKVFNNGTLVTTVTQPNYVFANLAAGSLNAVQVSAVGASGESARSDILTIALNSGSSETPQTLTAPAAPQGLSSANVTHTGVTMSWSPVNSATAYNLYRNGTFINTVNSPAYTFSNLNSSTLYQFQVTAVNSAGESPLSNSLAVTTNPPPVSVPAMPTGLSASNLSSSGFTLSWGAVSGASSYKVYRAGVLIASNLTGNNYNFSGLAASTTYSIQVNTVNAAGESSKSTALNVTTSAPPGITVTVSTLAGSGVGGFADESGILAQFNNPIGVATDTSNNVYVGDSSNSRIRKITPGGVVSTLAGNGTFSYADGIGTSAEFFRPNGVTVDNSGNVYVADLDNNRIRKITSTGVVTTLAGSIGGFADGTGTSAKFLFPYGVAVDNNGNVYVADSGNSRIRKITSTGVVSTLAGSMAGFADGIGTSAKFSSPYGVAVDNIGNVYVADSSNYRIRKITSTGVVTTLAGSMAGFADGTGTSAKFGLLIGVAVDNIGNVYVADTSNNRICKITSTGVVSTLIGSEVEGGFADGIGTSAKFSSPYGVAVDNNGILYVADTSNYRIRKITISQ